MNKIRTAILRGREPVVIPSVGNRVELHPATDAWMSGDRFGEVEKITRVGSAYIRMDRSKKVRHVPFYNIGRILP